MAAIPTGRVDLWNNTDPNNPVLLGFTLLDENGNWSVSTSALASGADIVTANYRGDGTHNGSTSQPYSQTVNPSMSNTSTSIQSDVNPSTEGQAVTFSGSVSNA